MDMPVNVPVDDPNADTEWNDILRKHGVIPEKPPSPTPLIQEALEEARRLAHEHRLEGKDLDQLDELEDDEDEDFLNQYRQKRMQEMSALQEKSVFGQVYPIQKPDYSREVTEMSSQAWVCLLLTSSTGTNVESQLMIEIWRDLARKYGEIKFCQMQANLCIEGYPDRNTPTVLIYKDTQVRRQLVTLKDLNRTAATATTKDWEQLLLQLGAIQHSDHRLNREDGADDTSKKNGAIQQGGRSVRDDNDDDSDWD